MAIHCKALGFYLIKNIKNNLITADFWGDHSDIIACKDIVNFGVGNLLSDFFRCLLALFR